ncbi:Uncharacterized protein dnm_045980 [Desulfonema magnum]|uniref:Uncharacterized protein n=1 Tax=Desulfonema magnum TaxID=45655 RepID=A0A975BN17_9BACT|nr:Uncharacterized protein dnm_045980 [Desulfonema magnum]
MAIFKNSMFKFFSADRVHWQFLTRDIIRECLCVTATKAQRHEVSRSLTKVLCVSLCLRVFVAFLHSQVQKT